MATRRTKNSLSADPRKRTAVGQNRVSLLRTSESKEVPVEYEDLSIRFEPAQGDGYGIAAHSDGCGEARTTFELPASGDELRRLLCALGAEARKSATDAGGPESRHLVVQEASATAQSTIEDFGHGLFEALLSGPVRNLFDQHVGRVESIGRGLRLRLHFSPEHPDLLLLTSLPWEYLYWKKRGEFLSLSQFSPVSRYLSVLRPSRSAELSPPLRILVAVSPTPNRPLDLDRERQGIEASWGAQEQIDVVYLDPVTPANLQQELAKSPYHIFHFMGHGDFSPATGEGSLVFNDGQGGEEPVTGKLLATLLHDQRSLGLVLLNTCYSGRVTAKGGLDPFAGVATALVQAGIPAVIAMQFPISDRAAIAFSGAVYGQLAADHNVEAATAHGRQAILADNLRSKEWGTPVLFLRTAQPVPIPEVPSGPAPKEPEEPAPALWRVAPGVLGAVSLVALLLVWLLGHSVHRARESILGMEPLEYPVGELLVEGLRAVWSLPWRGVGALFLSEGLVTLGAGLLLAITLIWLALGFWPRIRPLYSVTALAVSALLITGCGAFYTVVLQSAHLTANGPRSAPRCGTLLSRNPTDMAAFEICSWLENGSQRNDQRRQSLSGLLFWLLGACATAATVGLRYSFDGATSVIRWVLVGYLGAVALFLLARLPLTHAYGTWGLKYPPVTAVLPECDSELSEKIDSGNCVAFDVSAGARQTMLFIHGPCETFVPLPRFSNDGRRCVRRDPTLVCILGISE